MSVFFTEGVRWLMMVDGGYMWLPVVPHEAVAEVSE